MVRNKGVKIFTPVFFRTFRCGHFTRKHILFSMNFFVLITSFRFSLSNWFAREYLDCTRISIINFLCQFIGNAEALCGISVKSKFLLHLNKLEEDLDKKKAGFSKVKIFTPVFQKSFFVYYILRATTFCFQKNSLF